MGAPRVMTKIVLLLDMLPLHLDTMFSSFSFIILHLEGVSSLTLNDSLEGEMIRGYKTFPPNLMFAHS